MRSSIQLLLICIVLLAAAFAQSRENQAVFSFPGDTDRVHSATGDLLARYTKIYESQDSANQYLFSITDTAGNRLAQLNFTRSIEGMWSPYGESLYLNDFIGSTRIDCFVWSSADKHLMSLTEILMRDPSSGPIEGGGAKPPETPENSRYELTCEGWRAQDRVSISLEGDTWAGGQFKYKLIYDLRTKKFSWY
jgi:hypothetical protein